jgi:hypothetical protein
MMAAAIEYPKHLFNKGVRTQDGENIGHVKRETRHDSHFWRAKIQI